MPEYFTILVKPSRPKFTVLADSHFGEVPQTFSMASELKTPLFSARKAAGLSMPKLAALVGTSAQQIDRLEKGERKLTREWAERLAPHLQVQPRAILFGADPASASAVTVVGRIGAGAEILPDFEQTDPEGLFTVETVLNIPPDAVAFEVEGDSMWPRYDPGDIIVCRIDGVAPAEVIGWYAAVQTEDGKRYLKRVLKGAVEGTFDLESHNAETVRGVRLKWISPVLAVIPVQQWKRLDGKAREKLLKKVAKKVTR